MGGRVALKGTDGPEALSAARARGAEPVAPERTRRALARLADARPAIRVLAAPGRMGGDLARAAGLRPETTAGSTDRETGPDDTRAAAAEMRHRGVDLLLFAGGDGTARDIHDAIGADVPLIGIPTGVKMHSGVFAATPAAAGAAAAAYLRAPAPARLREAEIADVDEDAARDDRVATRLYGSVRVPRSPALVLAAKAASAAPDSGLEALCAQLAATLPPGRITLFGPGTTTARILEHLGLRATLLGVDAVRDGEFVATDLDEAGLLELLEDELDAELIAGVVGGQGFLFGRGNQQLSPSVLWRLGRERIRIVASAEKLVALSPPALRVGTGDDALDAQLCGHARVHVAPGRTIVMRISA